MSVVQVTPTQPSRPSGQLPIGAGRRWRNGLSLVQCGRLTATLILAPRLLGAEAPANWRNVQPFSVPQAGLLKITLPPETLGAARPALEDLRLLDVDGRELAYLIERSAPAEGALRSSKSFQVTLLAQTTVITVETGLAQPIAGVTLSTPAASFIKAVQIEGLTDGSEWRSLAQGVAIFRQTRGPSQLHLAFPPAVWPRLRLTVDDRRSEAIPFSGVQLHALGLEPPTEPLPITLAERTETPGHTRLLLNLPAANLCLASVQIDATDAVFIREVTVVSRQVAENAIKEAPLANGAIYRLAVEGQPVSANPSVKVEASAPTRELLLLVANQDSPPLHVAGVRAWRRPVYLVFHAPRPGAYRLLTGNRQCPAPHYDMAGLAGDLKNLAPVPIAIPPLANNPAFRAPEALPSVEDVGAALEVSAWRYRKSLAVLRPGVQQVDLDLEVLAFAQPDLADLRLLRGDRQLPFVLEHTSMTRSLAPEVTAANDPKQPKLSRWSVKLPLRRLPVTRLVCSCPTALFQRDITLYEEVADARGARYRRGLGQTAWVQRPDALTRQFWVDLTSSPETDTLFIETDNGDNPAIKLEGFQCLYQVRRLCFKSTSAGTIHLYYGNAEALAPRYDLSLVADQLLAAEKSVLSLSPAEQLKRASWREQMGSGGTGAVFWGALGLVVVGLLIVIARLLPKPPPAS